MARLCRIGCLALLWLLSVASHAQEFIEPDIIQTITLKPDGPTRFFYEGRAGEIVTITTEADAALDTILDLRDPNGARVAYSDDTLTIGEAGSMAVSPFAAIAAAVLPEDGVYTLYVNSFNGVSTGEARILLTRAETSPAMIEAGDDQQKQLIHIRAGRPHRWQWAARTGDSFQITARDASQTLDPILKLEGPDGGIIAFNDDHNSADTSLNTLDARLQYTFSADTTITLIIGDFLGREGEIEVIIERIRP